MPRYATSQLQPLGAQMHDLVTAQLSSTAGLLSPRCTTLVPRWTHSSLMQGMRSTDTQEKEIKNGRLAMVSCPLVLTKLTFLL